MPLRARWLLIAALAFAVACGDSTGPSATQPRINGLGPNRVEPGLPGFLLAVRGVHFDDSAVVLWNNSPRLTYFGDSTTLYAHILDADVATAGAYSVRVVNPNGERSPAANFQVSVGVTPFGIDSVRPTCCNEGGAGDSVAIYFNEALDTATLGDSGLRLVDSTTPVAGTATYDAAHKALRWSTPLLGLRFYHLAVGSQVRSVSAASPIGQTSFDFVTAVGKLVVLDTTGDFASLALGPLGQPRVAYRKSTARFAACGAICTRLSSWTRTAPDGVAGGGTYGDLVADASGGLYLAYQDGNSARVTTINGGSTTVGGGGGGDGAWTALAVGAGGRLHLFYFVAASSDLMHATCGSGCGTQGNWTTDVVDTTGSPGGFSATVVAPNGTVHVVYLENNAGDLKYARCNSPCTTATWVRGSIDSAGFVGVGSSLLIDGNGTLHLAYYDQTNGMVKYARCDSNCEQPLNWARGSILAVSAPGTGRGFGVGSLAIGPTGQLTFAFSNSLHNNLESASCSANCTLAGSWTTSVLSFRGSSFVWRSALKVDADGLRHLTWTDPVGWLHYMQY